MPTVAHTTATIAFLLIPIMTPQNVAAILRDSPAPSVQELQEPPSFGETAAQHAESCWHAD